MLKIRLRIDGMMCGMCESHVNDAVRRSLPVKKVTSSHRKEETVIWTEMDLSEEQLRSAIEATGYKILSIKRETEEKKGWFGSRK